MYVDPSYNASRLAAQEAVLSRARAGAAMEHEETLARRAIIEKKKEAASDALMKRQREEETRKRMRVQQAVEAERQRLLDEQRERERKRLKDQQDQIKRKEIEKQLDELKASGKGISLDDLNIDELDNSTIRAMKLARLEKDNKERDERVRITAKRIDHLERAFRREEVKHLAEDYQRQREHDLEVYERTKAETLKEALIKHKEGLALKNRLGRLVGAYDHFRAELNERRHKEFEHRHRIAEREFEKQKKQRIEEIRAKKQRERMEQKEAERRQHEEEKRLAKEAEERAAKEAAEKAAKEEDRKRLVAERLAKQAKADEFASRQRQRELEVEEKLKNRKADQAPFAREAAPMTERTDSNERPARLQLAGATSWRERLAAKEAAGQGTSPAPVEGAPPKRSGGYIPPALRQGGRSSSRDARDDQPAPPRHVTPRVATPPANSNNPDGPKKWVPPHLRNRQQE